MRAAGVAERRMTYRLAVVRRVCLSIVVLMDVAPEMAFDKHSGEQPDVQKMTSCAGCGFRRFAEADLPAVQHLHATVLHSTNAFVEVSCVQSPPDERFQLGSRSPR
jgi:hypothetical protein